MNLTKDDARRLRRDFIPSGGPVDINTLKFERTIAHEIYQCCKPVSYDPQSGPIYCGDICEYIAHTKNGVVTFCERHPPPAHTLK